MERLRCSQSLANATRNILYDRRRTKILVLMAAATAVYLLTDWTYLTGTRRVSLQGQLPSNQSNHGSQSNQSNQSNHSSQSNQSNQISQNNHGSQSNHSSQNSHSSQNNHTSSSQNNHGNQSNHSSQNNQSSQNNHGNQNNHSSQSNQSLPDGLKMPTTLAGVPLLLHFTYRDTSMLEAYRINIESCTRLNSNWTVILWTDDSVKLFLAKEFPSLLSVYNRFPFKLQRSDAIRYVVLYHFGGVYMDLDIHCLQPLIRSLSNIPCFLDRERQFQSNHLHQRKLVVMNSAMGCRPRHPFFKLLIDSVFNAGQLKSKLPYPLVVLETTGPFMLTRLYEKWETSNSTPSVTVLGETYFSSMLDANIHHTCRRVLAQIGRRRTGLSHMESSCLKLSELGFEKSDKQFLTNLTVAVHQFTHLGYKDQTTKKFDMLKAFPRVSIYGRAAADESADWPLGSKAVAAALVAAAAAAFAVTAMTRHCSGCY